MFFILGCLSPDDGSKPEIKVSKKEAYSMKLPGPRNCFWSRGPVSKDPYANIAYPDAGVFYWSATYSMPEGSQLELEGEFPKSRYMSIISYDEKGRPVESLADYLIVPEVESVNPFVVGNSRDSEHRKYKVEIVNGVPTNFKKEGIRLEAPKQMEGSELKTNVVNTLHAPAYGPGQQTMLYRIYVRDKGTDETGDAGLPVPVLTLSNGTVLRGDEVCSILRTNQMLMIDPAAVALPMEEYLEILDQPGKPNTWPATNPPTWFIQYDRSFLLGIYTGQMPESPRKSTGGFYPNLDNNYVRTIINRKHGKVFVLRGKIPKTPKTYLGDEIMTAGDLVYWSICSNQGFANTRVNDCLFDEQVPVDKDGNYVIVISRAEDRPRNARPECGFGWLPMADDGDGAIDEDVTVVQIRNMLADPNFKEAIQNVTEIGTEKEIMGPYLPQSFYMNTAAFEVLFPCWPEF
ncbi:MAG: hypothetical protein KJP00_10880 [Bacteroidia bacterium]|nr:hypothetical protein [Bacteroidia bacterium]